MTIFEDMADKPFTCPRCDSPDVVVYENTIECLFCRKEFDKEDLRTLERAQILSIDEKMKFVKKFNSFS